MLVVSNTMSLFLNIKGARYTSYNVLAGPIFRLHFLFQRDLNLIPPPPQLPTPAFRVCIFAPYEIWLFGLVSIMVKDYLVSGMQIMA